MEKKVLEHQFKADYFDEDFYKSKTGVKGTHKRDENNMAYMEFSRRVRQAFDINTKTILDIGAGVGVRTINYINREFDAYPCDVSKYAYDNSKLPERHYLSDIRDLKEVDRTFDIVIADRVLGYIPPEDSLRALQAIDSKSDKYIILSIICLDHIDPAIVECAKPGRINIQLKSFWNELFKSFPHWTLDKEKTDIMLQNGWSCIVVIRKDKEGISPVAFI